MKIIKRLCRSVVGFWLKDKLERFENFYLGLLGYSLARKSWCGTRITSSASLMTIDGYPRSANSFAVKAFMEAQGGFVRVGNHTHSPANLIRGVRLGKPALLVIRDPKDAILGYCAWSDETAGELPNYLKALQMKTFARRYIQFHKKLLPYLGSLVVADFRDVTTDYGRVIERVNERYNVSFKLFDHTKENQQDLFNNAPRHLSPSAEREQIKKAYEQEWVKIKGSTLIADAYNLYDLLT